MASPALSIPPPPQPPSTPPLPDIESGPPSRLADGARYGNWHAIHQGMILWLREKKECEENGIPLPPDVHEDAFGHLVVVIGKDESKGELIFLQITTSPPRNDAPYRETIISEAESGRPRRHVPIFPTPTLFGTAGIQLRCSFMPEKKRRWVKTDTWYRLRYTCFNDGTKEQWLDDPSLSALACALWSQGGMKNWMGLSLRDGWELIRRANEWEDRWWVRSNGGVIFLGE
ncbi:hypothetical protein NA57DRAFT_71572 [Rhizodiscina lignyota]|uniref:Uncharacterized protein n=1 Tax=Rhizodiscina lignyota TaxID=1504668 RepID=A0A9P4IK24_9PEZI|nr:hypothetical protein NA57DRAFT_71572 [Rhizodiscina lignyota]